MSFFNNFVVMFRVTLSKDILDRRGYEYIYLTEDESIPEYADIYFHEVIPEFKECDIERVREIYDKKLYLHQYNALKYLENGFNVILISGTGSGKTEAWALYALKNRIKVLAVYPTLALSQDQIDRLTSYYTALELEDKVFEVDRPLIDKLGGSFEASKAVSNALLVITNPAFLMADIKRFMSKSKSIVLIDFLKNVDLIVIDELDFYGSKGATLLLSLIELLERYVCRKKPQIVVLTATLGNPDELKKYLTSINNRDTVVIEGRAFKVRNYTYLILGKNLRNIWNVIQARRSEILRKIPDLELYLSDYKMFREYVFDIVEVLKEYGFRIPELSIDLIEILAEYVKSDEDCVTVVFTPSINSAEVLAKKLRSRLREELKLPMEVLDRIIATHHHLIDAEKRRIIEEGARKGEVKVIFTVRTLLQGIDIGTIARIVHYGIPEDVREYRQREGRKGRRIEIPFSESIVIPIKPWDRRLMESGLDGIKEYISMPLENIYINPRNKYVLMFKALSKLKRYPTDLTKEEVKLLKRFKLVKVSRGLFEEILLLSERGQNIWNKLNFYEFGLPYGVRRFYISKLTGEELIGEAISWRDLIEKYQPGCFDYSNDAIVVGIRRDYSVIERDLMDAIEMEDFVGEAYEQYYAIKKVWGEDPDIRGDYISGKLTSRVQCYIVIPKNGFGVFVEKPEVVLWKIESRRPRLIRYRDECRTIYNTKLIYIDSKTKGKYIDFTYGYMYELDPEEDIAKIKIGLAFLKLILRLSKYRISLSELNYAVEDLPRKTMLIWENECSGILESVNWRDIRSSIDNFKPSRLSELLLWAIDEDVATKIIRDNIGWDDIKKYAHRVLDYIEEVLRIKVRSLGEIAIPKPSKDLKLLSLDITTVRINDIDYYFLTLFDGSSYKCFKICLEDRISAIKTDKLPRLLEELSNAIDSGFKILIYGSWGSIKSIMKKSKTLKILFESLKREDKIIDVRELAREKLNIDTIPIEELEKYLNVNTGRSVNLALIRELYHDVLSGGNIDKFVDRLIEYGKANAYSIYIIYLIFSKIPKPK